MGLLVPLGLSRKSLGLDGLVDRIKLTLASRRTSALTSKHLSIAKSQPAYPAGIFTLQARVSESQLRLRRHNNGGIQGSVGIALGAW